MFGDGAEVEFAGGEAAFPGVPEDEALTIGGDGGDPRCRGGEHSAPEVRAGIAGADFVVQADAGDGAGFLGQEDSKIVQPGEECGRRDGPGVMALLLELKILEIADADAAVGGDDEQFGRANEKGNDLGFGFRSDGIEASARRGDENAGATGEDGVSGREDG